MERGQAMIVQTTGRWVCFWAGRTTDHLELWWQKRQNWGDVPTIGTGSCSCMNLERTLLTNATHRTNTFNTNGAGNKK